MSGESFGVVKHGVRTQFSREWLLGAWSPKEPAEGYFREVPKDHRWLEARASFVKQFERLSEFGREQGFLEHEGCYECSGALVGTANVVDTEWVPA